MNDLLFNIFRLSISTDSYLSYFSSSLLSTSTNFCYNNQLSTILSNHIPSILQHLYFILTQLCHHHQSTTLKSTLKFTSIFKTNFWPKVCFLYLCYLCSSVSMCVLTFLYITAIFQVIYTSIIMTNILNQDLAPYMW